MSFNNIFSCCRSPEIDKTFMGDLHQAAQSMGLLGGHQYLMIADGKLNWSTKKSEEVSLEVLKQFVSSKLKKLTKEEAKLVTADLSKIETYKTKFTLGTDELKEVMKFLSLREIASSSCVSRNWKKDINFEDPRMWKSQLEQMTFGPEKWKTHFGDVGEVSQLPKDILEEIKRPCPFWPAKKVGQTHMLVLIPATVNGKPLSIRSFRQLVKEAKLGFKADYEFGGNALLEWYGDETIQKSYWVLMTKDVIPDSKTKSYIIQKGLVRAKHDYQVPRLLDAIVSRLTEYVSTGILRSRGLTRCEEQIVHQQTVVGDVRPHYVTPIGYEGHLNLYRNCPDHCWLGVAAIRKLF